MIKTIFRFVLESYVARKSHEFRVEVRLLHRDGDYRSILVRGGCLWDHNILPYRMAGTITDISDIRQIQNRFREVNVILETIRACHASMLRAVDDKDLVADICKTVVKNEGYPFVSVGIIKHNHDVAIVPVSSYCADNKYTMSTDDFTNLFPVRDIEPVLSTLKKREPFIIPNTANVRSLYHIDTSLFEKGIKSLGWFPIAHGRHFYGVMCIYSNEKSGFNSYKIAIFSELARDISYGILNLRINAARKEAEKSLKIVNNELELQVKRRTKQLRNSNEYLQDTLEKQQIAERIARRYSRITSSVNLILRAGLLGHSEEELAIKCLKGATSLIGCQFGLIGDKYESKSSSLWSIGINSNLNNGSIDPQDLLRDIIGADKRIINELYEKRRSINI